MDRDSEEALFSGCRGLHLVSRMQGAALGLPGLTSLPSLPSSLGPSVALLLGQTHLCTQAALTFALFHLPRLFGSPLLISIHPLQDRLRTWLSP